MGGILEGQCCETCLVESVDIINLIWERIDVTGDFFGRCYAVDRSFIDS